jgi:hypothetical protein
VIKIRYQRELTPGLHGQAIRRGRVTIIELVPGLTAWQRRAALRRLQQQGRMGIGPQLPGWQLLVAQGADRIRTACGQVGAIVRLHPAGSTVPVMMLSGAAVSFLLLSAVSIRIVHTPQASGGGPVYAGPAASSASFSPADGSSPLPQGGGSWPGPGLTGGPGPGTPPGGQAPGGQAPDGRAPGVPGGSSPPATPGATRGQGGASPAPGPSPSPAPTSGGTTLTGTASTAPPQTSAPPPSQPSSPPPSPSGGSGGTSVCVSVGPLGMCVHL